MNTLAPTHGIAEELKVTLMTDGIEVGEEAEDFLTESGDSPITLSDYASTSGVTLKLPDDIWVNAPISRHNPNFIDTPANELIIHEDKPHISTTEGLLPVTFIPVPDYHDKILKDGSPITNIAITHSDRVRLSPVVGCAFRCDYCNIPFDREQDEPRYRGRKVIPNILEAAGVALEDPTLPAKHILISGGTPIKKDYGYENEVYERIAATYPDTEVDIMMVPMPGLLDFPRLKLMGISGLSINLELYNERIALQTMRSKAKASRELYLDSIEKAVEEFGFGQVRSLLLVGLEPLEDTLRAVRALAERGCDPVLSPFRPDPKTPLKDMHPPTKHELLEAWKRSREIISQFGGVALGPRCIPCMHNTLTFPDGTDTYYSSARQPSQK